MIRPQTCPICGDELAADAGTHSTLFPFCSMRCRQVDFYRWCAGKYSIVEPLDPDAAEEELERHRPDDEFPNV